MITIFTDGSSKGNPGPGGWGAIIASDKLVTEIGGKEIHTTNNRMELTACIKALESVSKEKIIIHTDSEYVLKGITTWIHTWQKKNWKTSAKKPVLNKDLWQKLIEASEGKDISWTLVRGHAGIMANERCDAIATSFADLPAGRQAALPYLYKGVRTKYAIGLSL